MVRKTQQRAAIRQVFEEADRPLSAPEVLQDAQAYVPGLGIATVYRNIKTLVEDAWIKTVELPGDPNRYELADRKRNVYFRCHETNRVFSFDLKLPDMSGLLPGDFKLENATVLLEGTRS